MKTTANKRVITMAALLLVSAIAGTASAGDSLHLKAWQATGKCKGCSLSTMTIPIPTVAITADMKTVGLESATLTGCTLTSGLNLSGYNLNYANFTGCKMNNVNMSGAKITSATFNSAVFGSGANLTGITSGAAVSFNSADLSAVAAASRPTTWPANTNLTSAKWTSNIFCSSDGKSVGGCYNATKCPPSTTAGGNTGFLNNDGTCKK